MSFADESAVLRRQSRVQGQEIAFSQQFVERDKLNAELSRFGIRLHIVCNQTHVEAGRATRHSAANSSAAKNAQGFAEDIVAPDTAPDAGGHVEMPDVHAARKREQQRESKVRHGFVEQPWCVGDDDADSRRGGHVDRVVADSPTGNDFQFGGG